jgi:DNA-binding transcriptional regulator PaaX
VRALDVLSFATLARRCTPPSTHTYRLLLVKEPGLPAPLLRRRYEALCSSAAEKRDYAVLVRVRQDLVKQDIETAISYLPHRPLTSALCSKALT